MHKALIKVQCPNFDIEKFDQTGFVADVMKLFADLVQLHKVSSKISNLINKTFCEIFFVT